MDEEVWVAKDAVNLLHLLSSMDISVPARTQGRATEHTERYPICRLLSTISNSQLLPYPFSLLKRERPDFLIKSIEENESIGIEVTEATSSDYSSYIALVEHEKPGHFIDVSYFRYGSQLSLPQKRDLLRKDELTGVPYGANEAEQEWFSYVKDAIGRKCKKLAKKGFEKFDENWLLIYDNTPVPPLKRKHLSPFLETLWPKDISPCFDRIFIESGWCDDGNRTSTPKIISLSCNGVSILPLVDIGEKV